MNPTTKAIESVLQERQRQDQKWGVQNHSIAKWLVILGEEFGESCKESLEQESWDKLRVEVVQTAAVAVAIIEYIDRSKVAGGE